jgi:hypothetical protein
MAAPNSWVIRDVPKATFVDVVSRKPLFWLSDLKTSGLDNTAETVYARGGTGNPKIVGFSSNREAKVNLENAVFDNGALALMTGNPLWTGAKSVQQREVLIVASNSVSLQFTPSNGTGAIVAIYKSNPDGSHGTEINYTATTVATGQYSRAAKVITFFAGELANGTKVIAYYNVNTDATAKTITISSDKFAGSFGLVLDAIVKSPFDQKDYLAQINIPSAKMEDNWSLTMAAEGDPSAHTMPIEILKQAGSTDFYTITLYDGTLLT